MPPTHFPPQEVSNSLFALAAENEPISKSDEATYENYRVGLFFSDLSEVISYCLEQRGRSVRFLAALLHKQDTACQQTSQLAPPNFVSLASACVLLNATLSHLTHLLFHALRIHSSQTNLIFYKHLLLLKVSVCFLGFIFSLPPSFPPPFSVSVFLSLSFLYQRESQWPQPLTEQSSKQLQRLV